MKQSELYEKYNIVKMELEITRGELETKVGKAKLSVADYVSRLKAQGMSKKDVQELLVTDLKTAGPLFSELRSAFSSPFATSVSRIGSTVANYEAAGGNPESKMVWVASFKNTCSSCIPRHGVKKKYSEWVAVGLPGNFGSFCNGYCQCRLYPVNFPGVGDVVKPNNRKQWQQIMSGKISDPDKLPGSLISAEEFLAKQQAVTAKNIQKGKEQVKELAEEAKALQENIDDIIGLIMGISAYFAGKNRQKVIDIFKKNGLAVLPDGRKIEDVIK
jgi:hypothetical protein